LWLQVAAVVDQIEVGAVELVDLELPQVFL
jgi:hypothetical protein